MGLEIQFKHAPLCSQDYAIKNNNLPHHKKAISRVFWYMQIFPRKTFCYFICTARRKHSKHLFSVLYKKGVYCAKWEQFCHFYNIWAIALKTSF